MNKVAIKKVIDAAESGMYRYGAYNLQSSYTKIPRFCILGIACLVAEREGIYVKRTNPGRLYGGSIITQPAVAKWLGLTLEECDKISGLNDRYEEYPIAYLKELAGEA